MENTGHIYTLLRRLSIAAVLVSLLCSCEKEIRFKGTFAEDKLVMYCLANTSSDTVSVSVFKSKFFLDQSDDEVTERLSGATVRGTINGEEVTFSENPDHLGTYFLVRKVQEGDVISLNASFKGLKDAQSTVTVPKRPKIELMSVKVIDDPEFTMLKDVEVKVLIHDDASSDDYYRLIPLEYSDIYDFDFWYDEEQHDWVYDVSSYREWRKKHAVTKDVLFMNNGSDFFDTISDAVDGDIWYDLDSGIFDDSIISGRDYTLTFRFTATNDSYEDETEEPEDENAVRSDWEPDLSRYAVVLEMLSPDLYKYIVSSEMADNNIEFFSEPVVIHNNIRGGIGCLGAVNSVLIPLG